VEPRRAPSILVQVLEGVRPVGDLDAGSGAKLTFGRGLPYGDVKPRPMGNSGLFRPRRTCLVPDGGAWTLGRDPATLMGDSEAIQVSGFVRRATWLGEAPVEQHGLSIRCLWHALD
jgi:hypothetical protein